MSILRIKNGDTWESISAIKGDKGDTGASGQDGHSPVITATKSGGVTTVYVDGTSVATINDGSAGEKGDKGDTGDSYVLTSADKTEIATAVYGMIQSAEGGEY